MDVFAAFFRPRTPFTPSAVVWITAVWITFWLAASSAGGESLGISPAAFVADTVFVETEMTGAGGFREAGEPGCEVAPVQLPHGVILNSMTFWVRDTDAASGHDVSVTVWEKRTNSESPATPVLEGSSSGSNPAIRAVIGLPPAGPHNVDTVHETFYVEVCYGAAGLELHHLAISYSGPPAGIDTASPFVVPAASFRSLSGRPTEFDAQNGFVSASFLNGGFPNDCLIAPVQLPEGVRIREMTARVYDSRGDSNLGLQLRRKRLNTEQVSEIVAEVSTVGTSGLQQTVSTTDIAHSIFDDAWEYFVTTSAPCPVTDSSQRIYAVRVFHTSSFFDDDFESGNLGAWSSTAPLVAAGGSAGSPARVGAEADRLLLPAAAFLPARSGTFYTPHPVDVDAGLLELSTTACSFAPVTLPDGATLVLMTAFVVDTDPARSLTVRLYSKNDNGNAAVLASAVSSGSAGPTAAFALLSGTVDTTANHYYVEACGPSGASPDAFGIQSVVVDFER